MSTIEYGIDIRDKRIQEIVAERLERGVRDGSITGDDAAKARRVIGQIVRQLLARKRLSPVEVVRIRARWSNYLETNRERRH